jgi:CRISPR system Cascade subunit CasC
MLVQECLERFGKINTFANETLPQTLMITLRSDRPVSLVGAFETPVRSTSGYVEESTKRLFRELGKVEKFVQKPILTLYVTTTSLDEQVEGIESV